MTTYGVFWGEGSIEVRPSDHQGLSLAAALLVALRLTGRRKSGGRS